MKGISYKWVFVWALLALFCGQSPQTLALDEEISPTQLPSDAPSNRALPTPKIETMLLEDAEGSGYQASFRGYNPMTRFTDNYYSDLKASAPLPVIPTPQPWDYRNVRLYELPPNLYSAPPRKTGTWVLTPRIFVAERYDANLFMTHDNKIRETYYNLGFGADFSAGSVNPETYGYDTISSISGSYMFNADIFTDHQDYNKISNHLDLEGRIGRDEFILRPYTMAEDRTGSEIGSVEQSGRMTTQTFLTGVRNASRLTNYLTLRSDFSHTAIQHPDTSYRDFDTWKAREELGWTLIHPFDYQKDGWWVNESEVFMWSEYALTNPSIGSGGQEGGGGFGWQGKFWERFLSSAYVGWSEVYLDSANDALESPRSHMSGIRFGGVSRFEATHRLFIEVGYSRQYQYSELYLNNNYIGTSGRASVNLLLSDNWYLIPQFVISHAKYETSGLEQLVWTPMMEIDYKFGRYNKVFFRFEYERSDVLSGDSQPVDSTRQTVGVSMQF